MHEHCLSLMEAGCVVSWLQALTQDEDDAFTQSVWANPKSLKQHFAGVGAVRLPH
jgi:hypothetical protein